MGRRDAGRGVAFGAAATCFPAGGGRSVRVADSDGYTEAVFGPLPGCVAGTLLWLGNYPRARASPLPWPKSVAGGVQGAGARCGDCPPQRAIALRSPAIVLPGQA
jgi:hypothetical protein